jgi:hypothetical protein
VFSFTFGPLYFGYIKTYVIHAVMVHSFFQYIQRLVQASQPAPLGGALALLFIFLKKCLPCVSGEAHGKDPNLWRAFYFEAHGKGTHVHAVCISLRLIPLFCRAPSVTLGKGP